MFRPEGWHYAEAHRRSVFKWIVSKEDPHKGPYRTGVMLQTFVGIEKATDKTPEKFCRSFLEARAKSAEKLIKRFPDVKAGIFERAGIEVIESVGPEGAKENHHVVYSVFWSDDSDLGAVMSAGCPDTAWDANKERFDVMGQVELIDMSRFVEDGKLKVDPAKDAAARKEVIAAIESLMAKPGDKSAGEHTGAILVFAEESSDVSVNLNVEYLPWLTQDKEVANSEVLIGAFVGGNMLPQLKKGIKKDHTKAGLLAMLRAYATLRKQNAIEAIESLDKWGAMSDAQIDRLIKDVAERAVPLDE